MNNKSPDRMSDCISFIDDVQWNIYVKDIHQDRLMYIVGTSLSKWISRKLFGEMMEPIISDDPENITKWHGYKIFINGLVGIMDNEEELLEEKYPGLMEVTGTYWFYRKGFRGSDDIVHFCIC